MNPVSVPLGSAVLTLLARPKSQTWIVGEGRSASALKNKMREHRAHLQVAVGVEQQVGRLQVAVDDVGRVQRLERAERLVDKVL